MTPIWTQQVTSPKAWRGDALSSDTSWIVRLTDAEIADMSSSVRERHILWRRAAAGWAGPTPRSRMPT
jgi:hypothetical protein